MNWRYHSMVDITQKLKKIMKSRKNQKLIYKKYNRRLTKPNLKRYRK